VAEPSRRDFGTGLDIEKQGVVFLSRA